MAKTTKEFDQTVCFTFFQPWVESIRDLAEANPEKAVRAFLTIADYCLYGVEPNIIDNPCGFTWHIVSGEAKRSINNRRRGFGCENTELTMVIVEYYTAHPNETQKAIAQAVGCSIGKVNKVIRRLKTEQQST